MNITVVGLGLIGGSIARRLRGFHNAHITAMDKNQQSLSLAKKDGVIDAGTTSGADAVKDADFIILCLYPEANINFIKENKRYLKSSVVITDVSGVKKHVIDHICPLLPEDADFVGGHPMAGREVGGYQSSTDTLFDNASYLITPTPQNKPEHIALVRELAEYIGCRHVITTTPDEHDAVIAYTSQLMHVVAIALCDNPMIERSTFFSAGSLRDCTRVAVINEAMWSELFLENRQHLVLRIEEMQESLEAVRKALLEDDRSALEDFMRQATEKKLKYLMD
jgi:prephenate dehydrogenase